MVWPFSRKKDRTFPQKLPFKDGQSFFEYQCQFGVTDIVPKQGMIAKVEDARKVFGNDVAVRTLPSGAQFAVLKVVSDDGGFIVFAETPTAQGPPLVPDDIVVWVPLTHTAEKMNAGMDERLGWQSVIIAKVSLTLDMSKAGFDLTHRYD